MLVILSQKVDSESLYADKLFGSYHYPARYKNQLHEGDTFVYYQGNRYDKSQRYYFGTGTVGKIFTADGENYYAELVSCQRFEKKIPIYLADGGYIEQLGYESVRNSINPPWQSSIRPLSQEAYDYILNAAGIQVTPKTESNESVDVLKDKLKLAVKEFYVEGDPSAIYRIEKIAATIDRTISTLETEEQLPQIKICSSLGASPENLSDLLDYCKTMKMSYSYKPVLILALLHSGDKNGRVSIGKAASFFREYYSDRKAQGLPIEKKRCIYLRDDVTDNQIVANLIANPVKALLESGYFFYDELSQVFSISPEIWKMADSSSKSTIAEICCQRLKDYYED